MIITLSSQVSSNGHLIGKMIAEKLNLQYIDNELIAQIAHKLHTEEKIVARFDGEFDSEQHEPFLLDWLVSINPENYLRTLRSALFEIVEKDNALIIGRGASFILQGRNPIFHIRIMAPINVRKAIFLAKNEGYTEAEAAKYIKEHEQKRNKFAEHIFNIKNLDDGSLYDLTLNLAHYTPEMAVDVITMAVTTRFKDGAPINSESNTQSLVNLLSKHKKPRGLGF